MKKYIFIMLIALFSILSFNDAKAQCDAGWTPLTIIMHINGCDFMVDICYKCSPLGMTETWIVINSFSRLSNCTMNPDLTTSQILARISINLMSNSMYVEQLCGMARIPPCPQMTNKVYIQEPRCMYKILLNGRICYMHCPGTQTCNVVYNVCWDPFSNVLMQYFVSCQASNYGTTDCLNATEPIEDPYPSGIPSACFHIDTRCD